MNLGLDGKVALVCGASRGLGRAAAAELAAEGSSVALCARNAAPLAAAAAEIGERFGVPTLPISADLSLAGEPTRAVAETLARFGRLDIVIANTGGPTPGSFATLARPSSSTSGQPGAVRVARSRPSSPRSPGAAPERSSWPRSTPKPCPRSPRASGSGASRR